ncbi:MAG: elongation factor 1-beta [Thermoproteota archaeon]|nr:elongation factor 1-beta [Candidatus Brockarchaeota archaeon]MBO3768088.1 elongation factor 1-beta [Candidatus Brockarchaeota archaeon]MBO3801367.1 elongation factor 1-beta [Candidatus Brockarchaeota archaeon]
MPRKVIMTIKIFPDSDEVQLEKIISEIKQLFPDEQIINYAQEPIAYGINALILNITAPEEEGVSQTYEDKIKAISGVGEVYIENVRRFVDVREPF